MLEAIDATAVRRWSAACVRVVEAHREEIDRLNVFPVADADTGTNLLATLRAADAAVAEQPPAADLVATTAALARGALLGARGNSGVIVSQVLRGVAEAARAAAAPALGPAGLRDALARADTLAATAVSDPAPGTVLTVLHEAAAAAARAQDRSTGEVARTAATAGARALTRTTGQLAVLAEAGVVDAGGRGLVLLLEALLEVLGGTVDPVAPPPAAHRPAVRAPAGPQFEVMYLLAGSDDARVAVLRAGLDALGDSVTVAGTGEPGSSEPGSSEPGSTGALHAVHVHCDDVGAALELGLAAGRPHRIDVTLLERAPRPAGRVVLALVPGPVTGALFLAEGARVVPDRHGGADEADVLAALRAVGDAPVTLLPNGRTTREAVRDLVRRARAGGAVVTVVPTGSLVQGLAALAVHDAARDGEDDAVAMAEAAAGMRRGALRVATERALTWAGQCEPGQTLGLAGDEVVVLGDDPVAVLTGLADRMVGGEGELVTALVDPAADPALLAALAEHLHRAHPGVELATYPADAGPDLLTLGVE